MNFEEFKEEINCLLDKINLNITDYQAMQYYKYMNLLIEWNKNVNLTAIIEPKDIILKHFVDSIIAEKYIKDTDKVVDIGSGAGFPGIPLKIIKPDTEVVLVDSLNKRIKFLEEVINTNNLKNIKAVHGRAEDIGHNKEYRGKFDIVTSRAVARLNVLLEYMMPLLKIGGKCICLKGPNIEEEVVEAQNAIEILGGELEKIEEIVLPDSDNKRTIVVIKSVKQLPNKYPRKAGTPTSSPL